MVLCLLMSGTPISLHVAVQTDEQIKEDVALITL